ncbi:MAG: hypothetical protein JO019_00910 [Candidatus Kaiserbacteria bacterium]|nr:hypothetical protein [Candidatus Kaiserbacteria bacterium]
MTLVEAVVWIAMFTAAMLAIVSSVLYFYRTGNFAIQEATAISSAQRGMDLMVRTVREASYASNGAFPIVSISTSSMTFYADVDSDSAIERVHYYLTGTDLVKGIADPSGDPPVYPSGESTTSVSDSVRNLSQNLSLFSYYDKNGVQITDMTRFGDVRLVTINLVADIDPNRTPTTTVLRSSAALRNLVGR